LRGGISTVSKLKYCIANNERFDDYDPNNKKNYIMYYDVNNLYGYSMIHNLPTDDFKWENFDNINSYSDLENLKSKKRGYILEVDLEYNIDLFDNHCELPLAPNHYKNKLSPNLYDKYNYRTSLNNLLFYLKHGLVLKKIHRILSFNQSNWLSSYIELNTKLRSETKNESERNFYKLMNNAV
jgi:hypothetical protein